MGLFDTVVILDEPLTCPDGHSLFGLQTKSFREPSMSTYLVQNGRVVRTAGRSRMDDGEDETSGWRISGDEAVHETRYRIESTAVRLRSASVSLRLEVTASALPVRGSLTPSARHPPTASRFRPLVCNNREPLSV